MSPHRIGQPHCNVFRCALANRGNGAMFTSPPNISADILQSLREVAFERDRRSSDAALAARVTAVKAFQQARFARTYEDLLADDRYAAAARYFLEDVYGPADFSSRDEQFARIVPALTRVIPKGLAATVVQITQLHALSEQLDSEMGAALSTLDLDLCSYAQAWRKVGRSSDRERQIALILAVGASLDRYTRSPALGASLRMMRVPARAGGLSRLQHFLEVGFDSFRKMRGGDTFLEIIGSRERNLASSLFKQSSPCK